MNKIDKVICLGKEFSSEDERREYFRKELRLKLPELKKIEGFPIGEDEDIINLSDPPYYTACPNPWLNDFIAEWEKEKESIPGRKKNFHVDEPYVSDVSEGKNNHIYNAHTYHTKVPHPAIMRYIMHYTQPGDIIFDGFAGTGMTGVAASMCGNPESEFKFVLEKEGLSRWGQRHAICTDLSPIATFIASNLNSKFDAKKLQIEAIEIINKLESKYSWMFLTKHDGFEDKYGRIDYTVWSDIFLCSNCNYETIYLEQAIDYENHKMKLEWNCPNCNSKVQKSKCDKAFETKFDIELNSLVKVSKTVPYLIYYTFRGRRYNKIADKFDLELIQKISEKKIDKWIPIDRIPIGFNTNQPINSNGITNTHLFYTKRTLIIISEIFSTISNKFLVTNILSRNATKLNRFIINKHNPKGRINGPFAGTLYIPSESVEQNPIDLFRDKLPKAGWDNTGNSIEIKSSTTISNIASNSIDYIFVDPPFGSNIMYSDLNFITESWLKIKTNIKEEAIENKFQNKSVNEYSSLMLKSFREFYKILKPGKWMSVEFSNTNSTIWNGIRTAIQNAGFIIANVAALDKKHGGIRAMAFSVSVNEDLVISCYKPSLQFENTFKTSQGEMGVWDFVVEHFYHLPVHLKKENSTTSIVERSPKIIYDRLITFYLMRGLPVPIDSKDFQFGLKQRFVERDGMYFTAEQVAEYDEKKAISPQFIQLALIVTNESEAIEWLKDKLRKQARKYQDIMPDYLKATQSLRKGDALPELQVLLNENFIHESNGCWRTPDPNEAKDREALRTKVLLKEFNGYVSTINIPKSKKLKEVRVEALRAGFKSCWEHKDFKTIVTLGDMIPQNILLEDELLLMYYDIAKDRV